jgi:hypothetical protein
VGRPVIGRVGMRFQKLTVVAQAPERAADGAVLWLCDCACGTRNHPVRSGALRRAKSCGCLQGRPVVDRVGMRFGRLTVVGQAPGRTAKNDTLWSCRCDCGGSRIVYGSHLKSTKSCGCMNKYRSLDDAGELTQARLRELLDYNPESGEFTWRVSRANTTVGGRAGTIDMHGYWVIGVDGKGYKAHRLAFLYVHGYLPKEIDHVDRNSANYRIANLRPASRRQNLANCRRKKKSGFKGVHPCGNRWQARIRRNGIYEHLGVFATAQEAHAEYCKAGRALYGPYFHDGSLSHVADPGVVKRYTSWFEFPSLRVN